MQPVEPMQPVQPMEPDDPIQAIKSIPNPDRRREILLLIFISIGILGLLIRGGYLAVTGIIYFDPGYVTSLASSMLDALAMLFCAALLLPALVYTFKHLKGQTILPASIKPIKFWQAAVVFVAWLFIVISGAVLASLFRYGWVVAAPLLLLGVGLPIFNVAWIGTGGLPAESRLRLWSVFGYGMLGGTLGAMALEYLVIGIAAAVITILAAANPELSTIVNQIKTAVTNANVGDVQALLTVLAPYITNPLVIVVIMVFAAVVAPLIEEAVKPAILWFLGNRLHFPAEGFVLGALCGAGFAMLEGLMAVSGSTQMWGFGLAGRAAASLMHISASGIMGWGIASARLEKRYGRLVLSYLLSVSLHGLWNGSAIMAVYGALRTVVQNIQVDFLSAALMLCGLGALFLELVSVLTALPLINQRLRRSAAPVPPPVQSDIIAPLATSNPRDTNGMDSQSS